MKKSLIFCITFLLFFLCSPLFGEPSKPLDFPTPPIDWNSVELNLDNLENNINLLKTDNINLQNLLNETTLYYVSQQIQLQNLENSLDKYEHTVKALKIALGVSITVNLTAITTVIIIGMSK